MRRTVAALICTLLIAACGDDDSAPCTTDQPVGVVVSATASAMAAVSSARFEMRRTGAPIKVQGMRFDSAVGQYAAPDSSKALLGVEAAGLSVEVGTVAIGPRTWITNPLTGAWEEIASGSGFNAAAVFADDTGWPDLIGNLGEPALEQPEEACGGAVVVTGLIDSERIDALTLGLVSEQAVPIELRIDTASHRVISAAFSTSGPEGTSDWSIVLSEYEEPVQIDAPG